MAGFIKKFICVILMLALILFGLVISSSILEEKHRSMQVDTFYDLAENSIDVLFVGSSRYLRGINSNVIYENSGISSYNRSNEFMSGHNQYLYVIDTFKTQSPKVVFLNTNKLSTKFKDKYYFNYHVALTKVRTSTEKLIVALQYQTESETMYALDIMFPVFHYHNRWDSLTKHDFLKYSNIDNRGNDSFWEIYDYQGDKEDYKGMIAPDKEIDFTYNDIAKKYLDMTIDYCKEQGAEVVLMNVPSRLWTESKYAAGKALAEEHDVLYLDGNLDENLDKIDTDISLDWHDSHKHYNGWGTYKFSKFLSEYMVDNFDLTDYRKVGNYVTDDMEKSYEEFYFRYHMFLPDYLSEPDGYDIDNIEKMKKIPVSDVQEASGKGDEFTQHEKYTQFEDALKDSDLSYKSSFIDVSNINGITGKRYELSDGTCVILVEYIYESDGHIVSNHNKSLNFGKYGEFPIIDPVRQSGFIMAFDGTKTNEQAMLLTKIYGEL